MPRLINPEAGTVVVCEGDLADHYRARGWVDADAEPVEPKRGRPAKDK